MTKMQKSKILREVAQMLGAIIIGFLFTVAVSKVGAWTEPTAAPPGGNVGAPINTSNITQGKTGSLYVGGIGPSGAANTNGLIVDYGNVGVGTTSPGAKLHVVGSGRFEVLAGNNVTIGTPSGVPGMTFISTTRADIRKNADSLSLLAGTTTGMPLTTNGVTIKSGGNVGIGTASPGAKLDVNGLILSRGYVQAATGFCIGGSCIESWPSGLSGSGTVNYVPKWSGSTTNLANSQIFDNGTNVGIGAGSSPGAKLDVRGSIRSTGGHVIINASPTIYFQDLNHNSGMIHMNSNRLYFLSGSGTDSTSWEVNGSYWPLYIDMTSDALTFGGAAYFMEGNVGIGTNAPTHRFDLRGQMRQTASSTYDVWIQGGAASSGDDRNLAILGVDEDSGDRLYVNYGNEYANGTVIGGNTLITGNLYAPIMYDSNNNGYYVDPNGNNVMYRVYGMVDMRTPILYDNDNTSYYVNPAGNSFMSNLYLNGRYLYFGSSGTHYIYTDNSSAMYYRGNHDTIVQQIFLDKQGTNYGRVYGSGDGVNFGFLDGDGNWSLQMAKDTATYFKINNVNEMYITPTEVNGAGNIITNFTAYYYTSDERLKENIQPVGSALDKILQLKGVRFNWKENGEIGVGFSAQEVEKVFPELVRTDEDGYKSVQYGNLTAPIVEAIKEQQEMIERQKKQIEDLRREVNQLKGL